MKHVLSISILLVAASNGQLLQTFDFEDYFESVGNSTKIPPEDISESRSLQYSGGRSVPARGSTQPARGGSTPMRSPPRGSGNNNAGGNNGGNSGGNNGGGFMFGGGSFNGGGNNGGNNGGGFMFGGGGSNSGGNSGGNGGGGSFGGVRGGTFGRPAPAPAPPEPRPEPNPEPKPAPSPPATAPKPAPSSRDQEWLDGHNKRRREFYKLFPSEFNVYNVPLKWSKDVAASAQRYANILVDKSGCTIKHGVNGNRYGGENLAANWGTLSERTPEQILKAWYEDEINLNRMQLVGQKFHASQVVWRSSKYVGCAHASKPHKDGTCYIQVCRYIQAGNCFIEDSAKKYPELEKHFPPGCKDKYRNNDWVCSTLGENVAELCGNDKNPKCPKEGCV